MPNEIRSLNQKEISKKDKTIVQDRAEQKGKKKTPLAFKSMQLKTMVRFNEACHKKMMKSRMEKLEQQPFGMAYIQM